MQWKWSRFLKLKECKYNFGKCLEKNAKCLHLVHFSRDKVCAYHAHMLWAMHGHYCPCSEKIPVSNPVGVNEASHPTLQHHDWVHVLGEMNFTTGHSILCPFLFLIVFLALIINSSINNSMANVMLRFLLLLCRILM